MKPEDARRSLVAGNAIALLMLAAGSLHSVFHSQIGITSAPGGADIVGPTSHPTITANVPLLWHGPVAIAVVDAVAIAWWHYRHGLRR